MNQSSSILIVGGGAFGTSTGYHLALRGYQNVTVVDRFEPPSRDAAATDLNKVIRADYPNPLYTNLGLEAMQVWKDPKSIFSGLFRETGWIMGAHDLTRDWLETAREVGEKAGRSGITYLSAEDIRARWPALTGDFPDWTNLYSPAAGWVPSGQALLRLAEAAKHNGVRYVTGDAGQIKELWYDSRGTCKGAISADGQLHEADIVVVAAGAGLPALVEGANTDVVAQTSAICVIQLEPHEVDRYRNFPVVDDFEQDENGLIKICSVRLVTNYNSHNVPNASVLHSLGDFPHDGTPAELEEEMRQFLRESVPELADRPFVSTKLCWDGMATDLNFRICPYPDTKNLFIATAGSNHGFKFMPVIGKYVADMIEGHLSKDLADLWSWKFGKVPANFQDPHPWPLRDLSELTGWKNRNAPAAADKLPWSSRL
ncbi:unnamed protein product [Clonostachys rosea f. rosea IK726]|uniref:Uncharacterized protein n=1 Tax=Clonostachys rosea f. rosea IK726 TaxID=1349383 RepID=A0ACA9URG7_BIOOC|nr:unnamed protein product [Clonostachys rosea f. rosea IK726]